jgi:hypothetical protein
MQHAKPQSLVGDDQPDVREGEATGVAERFIVPMKPDNAGEGKGPQQAAAQTFLRSDNLSALHRS